MKIIIEGADGTGKTTLAKILAEKYGLDICHCTQNDPADFYFYRETFRKDNIVWDRHTIGELVYPILFDREAQVTPSEVNSIIDMAKEAGVIVLVLTCDTATLKKRLEERGREHFTIKQNIGWINKSFCELAEWLDVRLINTKTMTLDEIFKLVEGEEK